MVIRHGYAKLNPPARALHRRPANARPPCCLLQKNAPRHQPL